MMKPSVASTLVSYVAPVALSIVLVACGDDGPASTDSAPSQAPAASSERVELPPDHPPLEASGTSNSSIAPPPPGSGQGFAALTWTAPEDWIAEPPSNAMRRAQYRVPGPDGDGECVIYYFGPGQGGDAVANAQRWADQFSQPDGGSSRERMESRQLEVDGIDVLLVEITGTYNSAMMMGGPTESRPGHMLLGAIAEGTDANWFFKFTGPEGTVRPQRQAFERMIRTLGRGV